jgi:nucleoside-diphosphate-sugar epimerase
MRADFFSGEGVVQAAAGVETIFYLAGAPYTEFYKHPVMVSHALDAAVRAGVKRFVHVGPVYSYGPPQRLPVPESQPHAPNTRKGAFRLEQEREVLKRHGDALATIVVHLPDFYGPNADLSYPNAFMREAVDGKTASWIGPLGAQREFIYVPDVAEPLLRLAGTDDAYGRCWNLGGRAIEAREFINGVFTALGAPPKYRSIPKFVLSLVGVASPMMREVAEMYYLFESGFVLDDSALRGKLGEYAKTPFAEGIAATLAWMRASGKS